MKAVIKWLGIAIGLGALWMATRAVVFYFLGVVAVFATAFQATVDGLSKMAAPPEDDAAPAPELRVQRDVGLMPSLIDLRQNVRRDERVPS